jgi:phosphomannomutase
MAINTVNQPPIRFGTDGWRGVIADDFTFARLALVAPVAAQMLQSHFGQVGSRAAGSNTIVVGYDRRFLSPEFAQRTAQAVANVGFDVLLAEKFAPTPAFSWAAYERKALGALVITASHNPAAYSGLKIKGAFGGSVSPELTEGVERILDKGEIQKSSPEPGKITKFDPWASYCEILRSKVDCEAIRQMILSGKLVLFADVMHGAAAGGLAQVLEIPDADVQEINASADPLFGGGAPEPLPKYLAALFAQMRESYAATPEKLAVGFVFDGDGDRIAAVDSQANFLSSQILVPILIDHLAKRRGLTGEVIKTISGLDLIPKVAALHNLPVYETAIGYKYIADRMLSSDRQSLLGGEESGGIGYGTHIPERDALLSALYVLEAIAQSGQDLSHIYHDLQTQTGYSSHYDRIDKHLAGAAAKDRVLLALTSDVLKEIAGRKVIDVNKIDGFKFRLEDSSWLLIRFSGTEPLLRVYCEASTPALVSQTLDWIDNWCDHLSG